MLTIRLARRGAKKRPFYNIVVTDGKSPRDGAVIERLGFFNPIAKGGEQRLKMDLERFNHWVEQGAQASERVNKLAEEQRG